MAGLSALTIGILVLTPEKFEIAVNDLYSSARTAIEAETVLSIIAPDIFSESVRQAAIRRCAGDGSCFLAQFVESGAAIDLLLTISVARLEDRLLLGLRLIDARTKADLATGGGEIAWDLPLPQVMEKELAKIFPRGIWGEVSFVEVRAEPAGAEVKVAGRVCRAPCKIERLAPGVHEVVVEQRGFTSWSGRVELVAKKGARVETKLIALPVESSALYESPWFWGAVVLGVTVISGALVIATRDSGELDLACVSGDLSECPE